MYVVVCWIKGVEQLHSKERKNATYPGKGKIKTVVMSN